MKNRSLPGPIWIWALAAAVLAMAIARTTSDNNDLTSASTFGVAIRTAAPIAMAGLAGLWSERSGTVNIGLEGMMILGTVFGGWFAWQHGPWFGLLGGVIGGLIGGLLLGVATITFRINHIVAGFAINILAPGIARFMANVLFVGEQGGSLTNSPSSSGRMGEFTLPVLSGGPLFGRDTPDPLGRVADWHWFAVSDLAGFVKGVTTDLRHDILLAVVLFVMTAYVLWHTPFGLRLRAAGERPSAADSLGVNVRKYRYIGVAISGMLGGLGGAILATSANRYSQNMTAGRGYLGLATLVVGNWRPVGVGAAATMFGFFDGITLRLSADKLVLALLLAVAVLLAFALVATLGTKPFTTSRWASAVVAGAGTLLLAWVFAVKLDGNKWLFVLWIFIASAVVVLGVGTASRSGTLGTTLMAMSAAAALYAYLRLDEIPSEFVSMLPYLVTLIVVASQGQALRPPAEAGEPY